MANNGFFDLARHHRWATARLLRFCRELDQTTLEVEMPGTYGSILETLRHMVASDISYIFRLTGTWTGHPWRDDPNVSLDVLIERSRVADSDLIDFLSGAWDTDAIVLGYGDNQAVFEIPAGVFVTQIFHHANEHRTHVTSALGALGIHPPDLSAWEYSMENGRSRQIA